MNKEVVIRKIRKGEETKACQLVIECFNEFVAPDYGEEGVNEFLKYVNPDLMQERLERDNFAFVAVVDDLITGVIEVRSNNHISLLFVKKEYQGRGIARELLELTIEKCRQADNTIDEFDVNSSPYAVKVYEKLGFTRVDDEKLVNGIRFIPMKLKLVRFPK
jgi:ribosomal protein S18 acetylase RimI-like enzyme